MKAGEWRCWCSAVLLSASLPVLAQRAAATVDLDPFLRRDTYQDIKISPTGEYYAATVPLEDRTILAVVRRSDMAITAKLQIGEDAIVDQFWWVNDERVMASVAEKLGRNDQPSPTGELIAVNADGERGKWLTNRYGETYTLMHDDLPDDERYVLITAVAYGENPETVLEKMDVYDGRRRAVSSAPVRNAQFTTDRAGVARFASGSGNDNIRKLYYREKQGADWVLINDESVSRVGEYALGFSADGLTAYLQSERKTGPDAIVAWNPATGERKDVLANPVVDPFDILHTADTGAPVGASYMHDGVRTRFFDPQSPTAKAYRQLEKAFPGSAVKITSSTRDGKLLLVQIWSDRNPGDFYLFDTGKKQVDLVFSRRKWFEPADLPPTRSVEIVARDGLKLYGYLTPPKGTQPGMPQPMVLLPHGGPFGIFDEWWYDNETQMLAAAGYAVLRVNYRGSGNYGCAFHVSGGKLQDDLTDATRWAIAQGIADPKRICIYGASYGGYAALMGAAKEPDLYRCAAGYVGVYDLEKKHRDDARSARSMRHWANDWLGDREGLAAVSPTELAHRIRIPVFLAAGGKDKRAPVEHTEQMEKALKKAGVPVESLYFPHEGHGFYTEEHRREFYTKLLAFLSHHLGGATAK
jgi:dipeptidyl aminopeptidase/acylaminoacyl peptidase